MKKILLIFVLLFLSSTARVSSQVLFTQSNVASISQAQAFEYRIYITPSGSITANAPILLTGVICTGFVAGSVSCTTPTPAAVIAAGALVTGAKSELTTKDLISNLESTKSIPFIPGASAPTALSIK